MNVKELEQRLLAEGCSPHNFSIGHRGSDVYCLENQNGVWKVFYTEREQDQPAFYESMDEAEACEYFFHYITTNMRYDHLVGFFRAEANAQALEERLAQYGIPSHRDKIPFGGWAAPRFRVFVVGKDIFRVREFLTEIPLKD